MVAGTILTTGEWYTGILNACTRLWQTESGQATPVVSIKDVVRSSVKVPEFDKHLKKAGGHIGRNVVEITIKMKAIVRKTLFQSCLDFHSSVTCRLPPFITSMVPFSLPISIPMSWLYILTPYISVSNSLSFFANSLMPFMYVRYLIFSCDLLSLYPAMYFLSMRLSGIIAIINSNGDSASPWNKPLWTFASAKFLSPTTSSTFQVFMVFSIKFMTSCDILYILRQYIIQLFGTISCF